MARVTMNFCVDSIDAKSVRAVFKLCLDSLSADTGRQIKLYPSVHGGVYGTVIAQKDGVFAGRRILKNSKLLLFGNKFNEALAWAKQKQNEDILSNC